jgi:hypothetical protein
MDALVASGDHGFDAEQHQPFAAQSRDDPDPYSLPAITTSARRQFVLHRRVVTGRTSPPGRYVVVPPSTPGTIRF